MYLAGYGAYISEARDAASAAMWAARSAEAWADATDCAKCAAFAAHSAASAEFTMWAEVRADVETILRLGAVALADEPLWSLGQPEWALHWGLDWGVWIDWYRNRLRGGSRGERYELVFAIVPLDAWEKGPQTANAWIEAHLAKE